MKIDKTAVYVAVVALICASTALSISVSRLLGAKEMSPHQIARVCHEANRAYCMTLGDYTQHSWDAAPSWQKESAVAGVQSIMANPLMSLAEQHANWMRQKSSDGWSFGKEKDPGEKTHPCMVPYDELPKDQKVKDMLFVAIVRALIATQE